MPWPGNRLPPPVRTLLGALALLSAVQACDPGQTCAGLGLDGAALVQMDVSPRRQAYRLKIGGDVNISLEPLTRDVNRSTISQTIFAMAHKDPFTVLMQFINVLFVAVRKETFMKSINDMSKSTAKAVAELTEKSATLRADFEEVMAGELSEDQLVKVTGDYFLKEAHLLSVYFEKRRVINLKTTRSMPPDVAECINQVVDAGAPQEAVDGTRTMTVDTGVALDEYCTQVNLLMANLTDLGLGMKENKRLVNGTQKVTPMLKSYLSTMKPELVPRIVWVLNALLDINYVGADGLEHVTSSMTDTLMPVLRQRLQCHGSNSGSAPKFGSSLLVGLLLVTRGVFALEEGLGSIF